MRGLIFANFGQICKIKFSRNVRLFGIRKKKSTHFFPQKIQFFKLVFNQKTLQKKSWSMIILVNYNRLIWRVLSGDSHIDFTVINITIHLFWFKKGFRVLTLFLWYFFFFNFDATLSFSVCTFLSDSLTAGNATKDPIIISFLGSTYVSIFISRTSKLRHRYIVLSVKLYEVYKPFSDWKEWVNSGSS